MRPEEKRLGLVRLGNLAGVFATLVMIAGALALGAAFLPKSPGRARCTITRIERHLAHSGEPPAACERGRR